jgi:two-component system, NarL family, response regulator NreC
MSIRVLLADDHPIVLRGLRVLLEREGFAVAGEAADGREAIRLAAEVRPDVAVLDLGMPFLNGIDAAREIMRTVPGTKTVLLTMHDEGPYILEAMRASIHGYVLKTQAMAGLVQAIRDVHRGTTYLSDGVSRVMVETYRGGGEVPKDSLSLREREVLQLVAEGKSTKQVAEVLGISVKTAESHRSRIMGKLDIHETASLVRYAIRRGLVHS